MSIVRQVVGAVAAAFRSEPRRTPPRNRARLSLEAFGPRLAPSSLLGTDTLDPTLGTQFGGDLVLRMAPEAPRLTNFVGIEIVGGLYRFEGDVIDLAPAGLTVTFGGEPDSLQGVTATTDANGHFDKVVPMKTDGSDNGTASAQTVNAAGVASNLALAIIRPGNY
ncbi:MAG TPA: hypothetical protein VGE74_06085 [Gemmata sp.]